MVWLFVSIPLMVLAVAVAVLPVTWESIRFNRHVHKVGPVAPASVATDGLGVAAPAVGVDCPLCAARIRGVTAAVLVDAVERHAWQFHGIPSAQHITQAARAA